jgi:hypothetical protein
MSALEMRSGELTSVPAISLSEASNARRPARSRRGRGGGGLRRRPGAALGGGLRWCHAAQLVEVKQRGLEIGRDVRSVADLGVDGPFDGLAVGHEPALVADRRCLPPGGARHGERAVDARALALAPMSSSRKVSASTVPLTAPLAVTWPSRPAPSRPRP